MDRSYRSTKPGPPGRKSGSHSARREYERRKAKDEEKLREKWGRHGGLAVALSDERQSTKALDRGAIGEELLGARLGQASGVVPNETHVSGAV